MTRQVGSVRGELEVWLDGEQAKLRYVGAEEDYTVKGKVAGRSLDEVVAALTTDPGIDEDDNPRSTSLA